MSYREMLLQAGAFVPETSSQVAALSAEFPEPATSRPATVVRHIEPRPTRTQPDRAVQEDPIPDLPPLVDPSYMSLSSTDEATPSRPEEQGVDSSSQKRQFAINDMWVAKRRSCPGFKVKVLSKRPNPLHAEDPSIPPEHVDIVIIVSKPHRADATHEKTQ